MNLNSNLPTEADSIGTVHVSADCYWGIDWTFASPFFDGNDRMPMQVIHALALIKKCAAIINASYGILQKDTANLIVQAAAES